MISTRSLISHAAVAAVAAVSTAVVTVMVGSTPQNPLAPAAALAQAAGNRSTEVMTQVMSDIAREMRISVTERDPRNASTPHRHPGHHTFGYVLEGTYEVRVDDGVVSVRV